MARRFAEDTRVPVGQSRIELENLLRRYGASAFFSGQSASEAMVAFEIESRRVQFRIRTPSADLARAKFEKEERRIWRALNLCIKAKLESVASGIETFEDAFLANIVMPDGQTVAQHVRPRIAESYKGNKMVPFFGGKPPE